MKIFNIVIMSCMFYDIYWVWFELSHPIWGQKAWSLSNLDLEIEGCYHTKEYDFMARDNITIVNDLQNIFSYDIFLGMSFM